MKRFLSVILTIALLFSFAACGEKKDSITVSEDGKFGAAQLSLGQEEFEKMGFSLGDSCDVVFSNGYSLKDVPYYNGYYAKNGDPVIVAYPGNPYVLITLNNDGIWDKAGLKEGDTVIVSVHEHGKYASVQETLGQMYSFNRKDYPDDETFCNFRALSGGKLKKDFLFRGASPVDNSRGRAAYTDAFLKSNGVRFVMDLADSAADYQAYVSAADFNSPYVKELFDQGRGILLDMGSAYTSQAYKEKVAEGLKAALAADGPVYIHCMEGKDRTGFVCTLLEALTGADYDEMLSDYMITYSNYYRVSEEKTPEKYKAIAELYFDAFVAFLHGTEDMATLKKADYMGDAKAYLVSGGMNENEIQQLIEMITD